MTTGGFDRITLRRKRKTRGLTHAELGRILGVTRQAVTRWEQGQTSPSIDLLPLLAAALHCSIDDLFTPVDSTTIGTSA